MDEHPGGWIAHGRRFPTEEEARRFSAQFSAEVEAKLRPPGSFVYFIRHRSRRAAKIGLSAQPLRRLHELQISIPDRLELVALIPGDVVREREMHERFAADRLSGEWFHVSPPLATFMRSAAVEHRRWLNWVLCPPTRQAIERHRERMLRSGQLYDF